MNGVMIPEISAGSNQTGASDTCTAHVSCPSGPGGERRAGDAADQAEGGETEQLAPGQVRLAEHVCLPPRSASISLHKLAYVGIQLSRSPVIPAKSGNPGRFPEC